jgi:hypothetical protein
MATDLMAMVKSQGGALVCWPELCRPRALGRGGDLARSRNCTRRSRASLAKSGGWILCNRWVHRPSRSSVLHRKEDRSPLRALARAFLPIISTSIKPLQTRSLIDRAVPQYGGQMETRTASPPSGTNVAETERLAYSIQESADFSASIISASIVSSSAGSYAPVAHFAGSSSFLARIVTPYKELIC